MKKTMKAMWILAASTLVLSSCIEEQNLQLQEENADMATIAITTSEALTRTHLDEDLSAASTKVKWNANGEYLQIIQSTPAGITTMKSSEGVASADGTTAGFSVQFNANTTDQSFDYWSIYPSSNMSSTTITGLDQVKLNLPVEQHPGLTSFDPAADLLISDKVHTAAQASELDFRFARPIAIVGMNLKGITAGERLISVEFSSNSAILAGTLNYNFNSNSVNEYGVENASQRILCLYDKEKVIATGKDMVFFTIFPTGNNTEMKDFTVKTVTNYAEYVKEIKPAEAKKVEANKLINLSVTYTAEHRTEKYHYNSYYEAYNNGEEILVAGQKVSKELFGNATLLSAKNTKIVESGVFFVPEGVIAEHSSGAKTKTDLIIIGDNPKNRSKMEFTEGAYRINFDASKHGIFLMKNIDFKQNTTKGEAQILFKPEKGILKTAAFENCKFDLNGFQGFSFADGTSWDVVCGIDNLILENCDFNLGSNKRLEYFIQYRKYIKIKNFVVKNNIFWCSKDFDCKVRLFNGWDPKVNVDTGAQIDNFTMQNNTWINIHPGSLNVISSLNKFILKDNLFYAIISNYTPVLQIKTNIYPTQGEACHNLGYVQPDFNKCWKVAYNAEANSLTKNEQIKKITEDPFAGGTFDETNGIFIPAAKYASYGAKR